MKNFLIFLSVVTVMLLASNDYKNRLRELDGIASKTPAQIEMKQEFLKPEKPKQRKLNNKDFQNLENSNNMYNDKLKKQQTSNTIPQSKQPNPLDLR